MKVKLIKQIHSCLASFSSSDVFLEKTVDLPFAPFSGLEITDGDFCERVESCLWDCKKNEMRCYTEEDKELYHNQNQRPIEEIVSEYLEIGWEK
jgi:hypothetical protein